jgi:hypothetical protein
MLTSQTRRVVAFGVAALLAGCGSKPPSALGGDSFLVCTITRVVVDVIETEFVGKSLVLRFEGGDKSAVLVGDILGADFSKEDRYTAVKSERPHVLGYKWQNATGNSTSELWLDVIGGDLYKLDRLDGALQEELYAKCQPVAGPII